MSLENVKLYYERLANDESFRTQIQNVKSKDECSQFVKAAGYDFTQEEFEEYTGQLLESIPDSELQDLDERELEAVIGGATSAFIQFSLWDKILIYGGPRRDLDFY
ncbi:Nif11 domain-containing protein [Nostoc sp. DSM 114161]|jgi:predicted ribosomally synthesized peptide with nif11-like leader|uniref:Nif11-like leader peptide family natural product precursor n=1 Tax=Nostoc sp. DSM 114161 TaxID=3440143 RepID=UPI00404660B1